MASDMKEFFSAISANDTDKVVKLLTSPEVDVNTRDETNKNRTALHVAALRGHEGLVKMLVDDCKADLNIEDLNGDVPLNLAANGYRVNIVKFLVSRNSVHSEDVKGILNDPATDEFFEAVHDNNIAKVKELLNGKMVQVDAKDAGDYKKTALHVAASKGYEELTAILVDDFKANCNIDDEIGDFPIHAAADNGHVNIVRFLAERKSKCIEDVKDLLDSNS